MGISQGGSLKNRFSSFLQIFPDLSPISLNIFPDIHHQNIKRGGSRTLSSLDTPLGSNMNILGSNVFENIYAAIMLFYISLFC